MNHRPKSANSRKINAPNKTTLQLNIEHWNEVLGDKAPIEYLANQTLRPHSAKSPSRPQSNQKRRNEDQRVGTSLQGFGHDLKNMNRQPRNPHSNKESRESRKVSSIRNAVLKAVTLTDEEIMSAVMRNTKHQLQLSGKLETAQNSDFSQGYSPTPSGDRQFFPLPLSPQPLTLNREPSILDLFSPATIPSFTSPLLHQTLPSSLPSYSPSLAQLASPNQPIHLRTPFSPHPPSQTPRISSNNNTLPSPLSPSAPTHPSFPQSYSYLHPHRTMTSPTAHPSPLSSSTPIPSTFSSPNPQIGNEKQKEILTSPSSPIHPPPSSLPIQNPLSPPLSSLSLSLTQPTSTHLQATPPPSSPSVSPSASPYESPPLSPVSPPPLSSSLPTPSSVVNKTPSSSSPSLIHSSLPLSPSSSLTHLKTGGGKEASIRRTDQNKKRNNEQEEEKEEDSSREERLNRVEVVIKRRETEREGMMDEIREEEGEEEYEEDYDNDEEKEREKDGSSLGNHSDSATLLPSHSLPLSFPSHKSNPQEETESGGRKNVGDDEGDDKGEMKSDSRGQGEITYGKGEIFPERKPMIGGIGGLGGMGGMGGMAGLLAGLKAQKNSLKSVEKKEIGTRERAEMLREKEMKEQRGQSEEKEGTGGEGVDESKVSFDPVHSLPAPPFVKLYREYSLFCESRGLVLPPSDLDLDLSRREGREEGILGRGKFALVKEGRMRNPLSPEEEEAKKKEELEELKEREKQQQLEREAQRIREMEREKEKEEEEKTRKEQKKGWGMARSSFNNRQSIVRQSSSPSFISITSPLSLSPSLPTHKTLIELERERIAREKEEKEKVDRERRKKLEEKLIDEEVEREREAQRAKERDRGERRGFRFVAVKIAQFVPQYHFHPPSSTPTPSFSSQSSPSKPSLLSRMASSPSLSVSTLAPISEVSSPSLPTSDPHPQISALAYPPLSIIEEFFREVKVLTALSHPNILSLFGVTLPFSTTESEEEAREQGRTLVSNSPSAVPRPPFSLVLENMTLGSLASCLSRSSWQRRTSQARRLSILLDVASGLASMHSKGFIHRDLKPHNVLLTRAKENPGQLIAKLADFGTCLCLLPTSSPASRSSHSQHPPVLVPCRGLVGTSGYTAPEALEGLPYSLPSDVFSFAILAWEVFLFSPTLPNTNTPSPCHSPIRNSPTNSIGSYSSPSLNRNPLCGLEPEEAVRLLKGEEGKEPLRPQFSREEHPPDLQEMISHCWACEPALRPPISSVAAFLLYLPSQDPGEEEAQEREKERILAEADTAQQQQQQLGGEEETKERASGPHPPSMQRGLSRHSSEREERRTQTLKLREGIRRNSRLFG